MFSQVAVLQLFPVHQLTDNNTWMAFLFCCESFNSQPRITWMIPFDKIPYCILRKQPICCLLISFNLFLPQRLIFSIK